MKKYLTAKKLREIHRREKFVHDLLNMQNRALGPGVDFAAIQKAEYAKKRASKP